MGHVTFEKYIIVVGNVMTSVQRERIHSFKQTLFVNKKKMYFLYLFIIIIIIIIIIIYCIM
jgi:hypothetical protein